MTRGLRAFFLAPLLAARPDVSGAQVISWQPTNGPQGASVFAFAVNGADHLFVATDGGGVFRSTDDGATWTPVGLAGRHVLSLAINAQGDVFAGTIFDGVFRSPDNGATWTQVNAGLANRTVSAIAVAPNGRLLAGTGATEQGIGGSGIYASSDNGGNWSQVVAPFAGAVVPRIAVAPDGGLLAGTVGQGCFRSADGGQNWVQAGLVGMTVLSLAVKPNGDVLAGSDVGTLYVSKDAGASWSDAGLPRTLAVQAIFVRSDGLILVGSDGIYRSNDDGRTWAPSSAGLSSRDVRAFAANSKRTLFVGNWGSVQRSFDNGTSWDTTNTGLVAANVSSLFFTTRGYLFANGTGFSGLVSRSPDIGASWTDHGVRGFFVYCLSANAAGHVFAGGSDGGSGGGVFRSTDDGNTWVRLQNGLPNASVAALAVDSRGQVFAGIGAYAPGPGQGHVYRSSDNGDSWIRLATPGNLAEVKTLLVHGRDEVFAGTGNGIFRSLDNGDAWAMLTTGTPVWSLAVSTPNDHLFAATFGAGVLRSTDNGESWTEVNTGVTNGNIRSVAVNARGDVFAGTHQSVYHSTNDGASWAQILEGLTNSDVYVLALSPDQVLLAGTYASGVFRSVAPTVPIFRLAISPSSTSVAPGASITLQVGVESVLGFSEPVSLEASVEPGGTGVSVSLDSTTVNPGSSTGMTATSSTAVPQGATFELVVKGRAGSLSGAATATLVVSKPTRFFTVSPCRLVDTRATDGPALAAQETRTLTIGGSCGVPPTAVSAAVNVTVTEATQPGHLRIFPAAGQQPPASAINFSAGQTRANSAVVLLGADGRLSVLDGQGTGLVHLVLDVSGYFQ